MKNIEIQIVDRIAELRKAKNMKITELAAKADLSASQISRIEHHQVSPPLATLSKIAAALEVKVIDFFKGEEENVSILIHRRDEPCKEIEQAGKTYSVPFFSNMYRMMEPVIFRVPPRTELEKKMHHGGEEYMLVLSGSVDFLYGRDEYRLELYDSVYFKGNVPHGTFNRSDEEANVLGIMTSRQNLYNGVMFYRFLQDYTADESKGYGDYFATGK